MLPWGIFVHRTAKPLRKLVFFNMLTGRDRDYSRLFWRLMRKFPERDLASFCLSKTLVDADCHVAQSSREPRVQLIRGRRTVFYFRNLCRGGALITAI
jgi:hypothetical protein